ncbi:MAG: oxygen-independent coproporphyrinogen III oxidase [Eubacterium sp.]|nr:oxygen-independent coproporphyrinogen III oxidase [Eubacterium sp.]
MNKLEIYIHIPFCAKKCDYCDFLSAPCDDETVNRYVEALKYEIECARDEIKEYLVDTIFIGGGTPSILEGKQITSVLETLKNCANISDDAEITIECNPGTVDESKLKTLFAAGINRISLGLQSANDDELKSIGRIHTYDEFLESYNIARECGFNNINVDLMSALPGQTKETYVESLKKVAALNPEHISAYSLIVEDETPLEARVSNGEVDLPDEDTEREMYYATKDVLEKSGYHRYEISNYAKEGFECRHNIGYWKRVDYMGFGIGAASLVKNERYNNISELNKYIAVMDEFSDVSSIRENVQKLSIQEQMEEFMFLGLRMIDGISKTDFENCFGKSIDEVYGDVVRKEEQTGNLICEKDRIRLSDKGIDISNIVLAKFLL